MLALALITILNLAPDSVADEPMPPCSDLPPSQLANASAFARVAGDETWQHYPDELRDRRLLGCLFKQYLGYPLRGQGSVTQAEATASKEIAALVRNLAPEYAIEVVIDGAEDVVPFASGNYNSEDDFAAAMDRHEQRANDRAKGLARRVRSMVPPDISVNVGAMRLNEAQGRRGIVVFVRFSRKPAPIASASPPVTQASVTSDSPSVARNSPPPPCPPSAPPAPPNAPDGTSPPVQARWMFSPYVRAFYIFGHGNSYVWDHGGEIAGGLHFSRRFRRWAFEFSSEFRFASIQTTLDFDDGADPLSVKHYLFPVMLGVSHRGLVAGVELAPGYLDERLHPELSARKTIRRVSLTTGLYAGYRFPLPNNSGPWVEFGYLFSWVHSPRFPSFEQDFGYVHSLSVRVGWGFSHKRRTE